MEEAYSSEKRKEEEKKPSFEEEPEEEFEKEEPEEDEDFEEEPEEVPEDDEVDEEPEEHTEKKEADKKPEVKAEKKKPISSGAIVWQVITAILAVLLVVSIFTGGFKFGQTTADVAEKTEEPTTAPAEVTRVSVSADDDPAKGPADAKVTIIEFSDYQCPYCSRGEATMKQIEEAYGSDVRIVFRDFPLSFHENAQKSAEAAQCANEQGKYWEYHDKLFANQNALDTASLKSYAVELGLDTQKFNSCVDTSKYAEEVKKDINDGKAAGVQGTPAFFINGRLVSGAQPFANFKKIIDEELL